VYNRGKKKEVQQMTTTTQNINERVNGIVARLTEQNRQRVMNAPSSRRVRPVNIAEQIIREQGLY
jgi:hypothetical protein